jgi:hypothetical protein
MTTHATPYRMNYQTTFRPAEIRVSPARPRRIPWRAIAVVLVLASGIVASGVAVFSVPKFGGRPAKTPLAVKSLHAVAEAWRANHGNECPTPQRLKEEKELAASSELIDAWGSPYVILCSDEATTVISFGPDKKARTEDDIVFPDGRAPR